MSSAYLPSNIWLPSAQDLQSAFNRRVPLGWTVLYTLGIASAVYVVADIYDYFFCYPVATRTFLPQNPLLYILSGLVRLYRNVRGLDGTQTKALHAFVKNKHSDFWSRRFLKSGDLEVRRGPRPAIIRNGIPHRTVPQILDPQLKADTEAMLASLAEQRSDLITTGPSINEVDAHAPALFLKPSLGTSHPDVTGRLVSAREFAHVHDVDNSMHMYLAPLDAAEVIEKGWAIRFPLAGWLVAQGYVMVYAPRDAGELEVLKTLVGASLAWITSLP